MTGRADSFLLSVRSFNSAVIPLKAGPSDACVYPVIWQPGSSEQPTSSWWPSAHGRRRKRGPIHDSDWNGASRPPGRAGDHNCDDSGVSVIPWGKKQERHWKPVYKDFIQAGGNHPQLPRHTCCCCRADWYHPIERPETKPVKRLQGAYGWGCAAAHSPPLKPEPNVNRGSGSDLSYPWTSAITRMRVIKPPWAETPGARLKTPASATQVAFSLKR